MAQPQTHQLIQRDRPGAEPLSSQPQWLNLIGELTADLERAGGGRPGWLTAQSSLTVTAATGVALLPSAAPRHHRQ
jgi:hypothetical protein